MYCRNLCIVVLYCLGIRHANGQTEAASNATQVTANIKPVPKSHVYQTEGFTGSNVTSGPILIVDKKTIFISNLNYISKSNDTYFWTGVGEPSVNGVLVPDENNSKKPLTNYQGKNIYLRLPDNLTTDKIDYIALWSAKYKTDLGYVVLYNENSSEARNTVPDALGYHNTTKDNKEIFRIPFCCGQNKIYPADTKTCTSVEEDLPFNLTVFESNETHIDPDRLMGNIEFAPYAYFVECSENFERIVLDDKEILGLNYNGSLLYYLTLNEYGFKNHGEYCILYRNVVQPNIVVCLDASPTTVGASIQWLYIPFLILSTICFLACAVIYTFWLKIKDTHRKCFVGYSISMVVTFTSLIFLQKMSSACNFMGGLFMYSMICSFVWLACLCIDLIFVVNSRSAGRRAVDDTRIYIYISISLFVPVVILVASLIPEGTPDIPMSFVKTYSGTDSCYFEDVKIEVFFTPIFLLILTSIAGLGYTSYIINSHHDRKDYEWIQNKSRFKFMVRSCFLVWLTTFIWLIDALANVVIMGSAIQYAIDLIEALQGTFVTIIFVLNKYARKEIKEVVYKKQCQIELQSTIDDLLNDFDNPNSRSENNRYPKTEDK